MTDRINHAGNRTRYPDRFKLYFMFRLRSIHHCNHGRVRCVLHNVYHDILPRWS